MSDITIYTKDYCPYCARAKALLGAKGASFNEINVTHDAELQAEMMDRSQRRTVPQIFIDERHIGGSDDLAALEAAGELDPLLGNDGRRTAWPKTATRHRGTRSSRTPGSASKIRNRPRIPTISARRTSASGRRRLRTSRGPTTCSIN